MRVRADIKCHACGFVSGEVIGIVPDELAGPRRARIRSEQIIPSALCPGPWPTPGQPVRCARCNGAVYLDDLDVLREHPRSTEPMAVATRREAARAA
jgi:hypothetical protein